MKPDRRPAGDRVAAQAALPAVTDLPRTLLALLSDPNVASREEWERTAAQCPGIGQGPLHSRVEIEGWVRRRLREGFVED
jgi:hypothetical protein